MALALLQSANAQIVDADGDGLLDSVETNTGKYVSPSNTGTSPSIIDTDGDLVSDFDEVNATPPTDPNDPSKYPNSGFTRLTTLHALPIPLVDGQQLAIDESFAPYGHRPDRDKLGDDGSSTVIDRNGVLIWTNKSGAALTIPNSSLAKTLHVSNTECLVYNNYFKSWNALDHIAEIVIYRRGALGGIISSKTVNINGTIIMDDVASVTPTTYGYMIVTGDRVDDGAESTQVPPKVAGDPPVVVGDGDPVKIDYWDGLYLALRLITWDGQVKILDAKTLSVPKANRDFGDYQVLGNGSDGSMVITMLTAGAKLDKHTENFGTIPDIVSTIWISAENNKEDIIELFPLPDDPEATEPPATLDLFDKLVYVDNNRTIGYLNKGKTLLDYRLNGSSDELKVSPGGATLAAVETILPLAKDSIRGLNPYFYTIDATGFILKLYRIDSTIAPLGGAVTLPTKIDPDQDEYEFVRNPRDGALLIKAKDGHLIWVPTTNDGITPEVTGLGTPQLIPDSAKAKPLFVAAKECLVWLNSDDQPLNGVLTDAKISHYQLSNGLTLTLNLTPPIEGKYVVLPNPLSPEPDLEGWYLTTFEKDAPNSALMRNYQLQAAGNADRDRDGISDYDELAGTYSANTPKQGTDPLNADTDGDGLSDTRELLPYEIVPNLLNWESARLAAISQGVRLAVLDTEAKQTAFSAAMAVHKASGKFWVGGHDTIKEGEFRWLNALGEKSGAVIGTASYKNWQPRQPNNLNNADAMEVSTATGFKWAMAPVSRKQAYVVEYEPSDPNEADGPSTADADGDGVSDYAEKFVLFSDPKTGNFLTPITDASINANGSYEGLLYSEENGLVGWIKLTLSGTASVAKSFSGNYKDIYGSASSITGTFKTDGSLNQLASTPDLETNSIEIAMQKQASNRYHLHIAIETQSGDTLFAKARPALTAITPIRPKLTFEAKLAQGEPLPSGAAIATGTLATSALSTFQIYMPDGSTATNAASVLDGDVIALYAKSTSTLAPALLGNLKLVNLANKTSNLNGVTRLVADDYDQVRDLIGSFYLSPTAGSLPLKNFALRTNSAVFNWSDGELDTAYQIASWLPNRVTTPKTNYDSVDPKNTLFDAKTGLLKVSYTRSDKDRNLNNAKSTAFAVVNQARGTFNGFYTGANSAGGFKVTPNTELLASPVIIPSPTTPTTPTTPVLVPGTVSSISLSSKEMMAAGGSYSLRVTGTNNWQIIIPSTASWISTTITNDDGFVYTPAPKITGSGNATVQITVAPNATGARREANINIGGRAHKIVQAYR